MFIHELWSDKFLKLETVPEKSQKSLPKKQQLGEFWTKPLKFRPKIDFFLCKNSNAKSRNPAYAINEKQSRIQIFRRWWD